VTIATCYVSPEGVVLGADSTSTVGTPGGFHYFNYAQKLFEIGEGGTLGAATWGLGGLIVSSHRMLLAELADDLAANPPANVLDAANRWAARFWTAYSSAPPLVPVIQRLQALAAKPQFDPRATTPNPAARTKAEEDELIQTRNNLIVGFCIAGHTLPSREAMAFELIFDALGGPPNPTQIPMHSMRFWGAPNMILRLIRGCDDELKAGILNSGHWTGTLADLDVLIMQHELAQPGVLPIRDAIDFTHACIASTIKAMKFSSLAQICGGPIEVAVITSDRKFRWVRHKSWDAAITEGEA
jgi:hypothetical protein